jgi:TonB family protein
LAPAFLAKDASGIGEWARRDGNGNANWLESRFREGAWLNDNALRKLNGQPQRPQAEYLSSDTFASVRQSLQVFGQWKLGDATHTWVFQAPGAAGEPLTQALELEDLSGPEGYRVRVTLHCYAGAAECTRYRERQSELLAPKPDVMAGALALRQWRNRVHDEDCIMRPINMEQPRYPPDALRDGIGGTVHVGVLFNRCGNVRDAWIIQSSRHRSLDRAAMHKALEWQLDLSQMPPEGLTLRMARVPISFHVE